MYQSFLINSLKRVLSLFILFIYFFLTACGSGSSSSKQNISTLNDQKKDFAILDNFIQNATIKVIDLDNNETIYTTKTDNLGSFKIDIDNNIKDETWLKLIVSSGKEIDLNDYNKTKSLKGELLLLCKAKDIRENSVNINIFTTISTVLSEKSLQNREDYLNSFAKEIFRTSIDEYSGIDYRDIYAYKPNYAPDSFFKRADLYKRLYEEKVMQTILDNGDLYTFLMKDSDGDTLTFWKEMLLGTSDKLVDSDGDGIDDNVEVEEGLDPTLKDSDFDDIDDLNESLYGTSPTNPDTDGDYIPDGVEIKEGRDPLNADEDNDGVLDGLEGDPFFKYQWYIQSLGKVVANTANVATIKGNDLGILTVYHKTLGNSRGHNSIVQVVDSGVELKHEDLDIDLNDSLNAVTHSNDPTPTENVSKDDPASPLEIGHGTAVAGIIGAKTNNGVGIRGIVPRCDIAGSNWLENQTIDELEKVWYSQINNPQIGVSNNSWGAYYLKDDDFERIMKLGVEQLRNKKGRIYVFAAGNFRQDFGNANLSYLTNNPYAFTVAALNAQDKYASYSSPGSNILVSAYGGEHYYTGPTIMTTSLSGYSYYKNELNGKIGTITVDEDKKRSYTYAMNGTSSAAPMVSASIALVLDACPNLSWRDVRWLIAHTAKKIDPSDSTWITNGVGLHYSINYGYGKINPNGMIDICRSSYFVPLGPMKNAFVEEDNLSVDIPDNNTTITQTINFPKQLVIEWVGLTIDTNHPFSGDLEINLISPMGTKVNIVTPNEVNFAGYKGGFRFGSVAFIDEKSKGIWKIEITDRLKDDKGILKRVRLEVYGHEN